MDRQYNVQIVKDHKTNDGWQNTTEITKDWTIRTPLKTGVNSGAPEKEIVPQTLPSCHPC